MRWPWVSRKWREYQLESANKLIDALLETRQLQADRIRDLELKNEQLIQLLPTIKCNDYTQKSEEKPANVGVVSTGRGGWRARAQIASEGTMPAPKDSLAELEKRVKDQGGK